MKTYKTKLFSSKNREKEKQNIRICADAILRGEVIAFPTETVYGLGANAFDERAIKKIFRVKRRPADNPMIVHVASIEQAENLFQKIPKHFYALAHAFLPGPLSIIGYKNVSVPDIVTAGLTKVAVRMPAHRIARALIRTAGVPLVAPSANISGSPSPTTPEDVMSDLGGKIFGVLDGGQCKIGIESTVIDLTGRGPTILRPGKITAKEIEDIIHTKVHIARQSQTQPASPGMKYIHYAPKARLILFYGEKNNVIMSMQTHCMQFQKKGNRVGLLAPNSMTQMCFESFYSLGDGSSVEYARRMYKGMRELDDTSVDIIFCPAILEEGLGLAVMNRLKKAASRKVKAN